MALVKKCKHGRDSWSSCSCSWYAVRRKGGRQVYENLGPSEREARRRYRTGERLVAGATFADLADRWIVAVEPRIRPSTAYNYRHALSCAKDVLGHVPVGAITAAHVAEMEAALAATGLAPGTITNVRVVAMGVLRFAEDAGIITTAPNLRRVKPLARAQTVKHLPPADIERLLAGVESDFRRLFAFGWLTGLRPGELLAIEPGDVRGRVLYVSRQLNTRNSLMLDYTKTPRSRRRVDLSPRALEQLVGGEDDGRRAAEDGRIWPFSYASAAHRWRDAIQRCWLPPMGMHALRHSNASLRLAAGQDIVYVADQLGHATANVTLRTYAHLIPRPDRDASEIDEAIRQLGGSPSDEARPA